MAIYSLHVKAVSRSSGRSVVAAAAYRAAEKMVDDRLGVVWDFTAKRGVLQSEIIAPAGAPEWALDRAELWNAAERAEDKSTRRSSATNTRTARPVGATGGRWSVEALGGDWPPRSACIR